MTTLRTFLRASVPTFALLLLNACGGGGGESSSSAPPQRGGGAPAATRPVTTAVVLDRSSSLDVAAMAIAELALAERPAEHPYLPEMVARAKAIIANAEDPCPGGGSIDEKQNLDEDLTGTLQIAFHDCVQGGVRQNGSLDVSIDEFDAASGTATRYTIEFKELTFSVDQLSAVATGTAAVHRDGEAETTTLNLMGRYSPDELAARFEDAVIRSATASSGGRRVSISGRMFHSLHGYVDISTLEELALANASVDAPSGGSLRLTGAQNATADIGFAGQRLRLSLDADANGRVDAGLSTTWSELMDTRNFAPAANAGADATVQRGATVKADASGSADWEGDALTYQWTLTGRPSGSHASVAGSSASVSFTPDVAGHYDLQVTVRDAAGASSDSVRFTVLGSDEPPPLLRPVAIAGLDQITVEGQGVAVDGSLSVHPTNAPLTYAWRLTDSPSGSAAAVSATTASFQFVPDVPGFYALELSVTDGQAVDTDTMRVIAESLVAFTSGASFRIRGKKDERTSADLRLRTSRHYRGAPVAVTASSNASWLRVVTPHATTAAPGGSIDIRVELVPHELERLRNGTYKAQVTATPAGGQRAAVASVSLSLKVKG